VKKNRRRREKTLESLSRKYSGSHSRRVMSCLNPKKVQIITNLRKVLIKKKKLKKKEI
jgi:hypothetical protein